MRSVALHAHDSVIAGGGPFTGEGLAPVVDDLLARLRVGDARGDHGKVDRERGDGDAVEVRACRRDSHRRILQPSAQPARLPVVHQEVDLQPRAVVESDSAPALYVANPYAGSTRGGWHHSVPVDLQREGREPERSLASAHLPREVDDVTGRSVRAGRVGPQAHG